MIGIINKEKTFSATSFQNDELVKHTVLAVCKAPKIRPNFHFVGTMAVKFIKTPV